MAWRDYVPDDFEEPCPPDTETPPFDFGDEEDLEQTLGEGEYEFLNLVANQLATVSTTDLVKAWAGGK